MKRIVALCLALALTALALPQKTTSRALGHTPFVGASAQAYYQIYWDDAVCLEDQLIYVVHVYTESQGLWGMDRIYLDGRVEHLYDGYTPPGEITTTEEEQTVVDDPQCRLCITIEREHARQAYQQKADAYMTAAWVASAGCGYLMNVPAIVACVGAIYATAGAQIYALYIDMREQQRQIPYRCLSSSGRPCAGY